MIASCSYLSLFETENILLTNFHKLNNMMCNRPIDMGVRNNGLGRCQETLKKIFVENHTNIYTLGLEFQQFLSFSDNRNELGMTSITRN